MTQAPHHTAPCKHAHQYNRRICTHDIPISISMYQVYDSEKLQSNRCGMQDRTPSQGHWSHPRLASHSARPQPPISQRLSNHIFQMYTNMKFVFGGIFAVIPNRPCISHFLCCCTLAGLDIAKMCVVQRGASSGWADIAYNCPTDPQRAWNCYGRCWHYYNEDTHHRHPCVNRVLRIL